MKLVALTLLCLFTFSGFSQIQFYKQFSNNGYDFAEGIVQLPDSSYLITGSSSSFGDGPAQAFLLKIDSLGAFEWSKSYGGIESEGGRRVMFIPNDGIFIAGFTNSFGAGAYDFYLAKTDMSGNLIWEKSYGTSSWERIYDAALTRDSGFILVGETTNTLDGESDMYIVRTDKNGNQMWTQQIGEEGEDIARTIDQIDDSTFAIGGVVYSSDSLASKGYLARIQDNGTLLWSLEIGPIGHHDVTELTVAENRINCVGMSIRANGDTATITTKYGLDGAFQFYIQDGALGADYGSGICKFGLGDKYCVALTSDNQYSFGGWDVNFIKYQNDLYYELKIAGVNFGRDEFLGELIATSDYGAIAVGTLMETAPGGAGFYVIKMRENGSFFNSGASTVYSSMVNVNDIDSKNENWKIYPNPTSDKIVVSSENLKKGVQIQLIDLLGRIVFESEAMEDFNSTLDLSIFPRGMYSLVIKNELSNVMKSVILN